MELPVSHDVRTHVRTVNGKKVTVHRHARQDDGGAAEQKKRHAFEARVLRERQQQEAVYEVKGKRTPGERRGRKKSGWTRAKGHARKARRLYRRHKARAAGHAALAVGWAAAYGTRKAYLKLRAKLQAGR
jgi:hypothetical protein